MPLLIIEGTYRSLAIIGVMLAAQAAFAVWLGNKVLQRGGAHERVPEASAAVQRAGYCVIAGALLATASSFAAAFLEMSDTRAIVLFIVCSGIPPIPAFIVAMRHISRTVAASTAD